MEMNILYVLPSSRIVTLAVDVGTLDSTCDDGLDGDSEIWSISDWYADDEGEEFCDTDQADLDLLDDIEILEMAVNEANRG
jgi:hypothetical protein